MEARGIRRENANQGRSAAMPSTSSPSPEPDRPVSAVEAPAPGVRRSRAADRALALPHGLLVLLRMAGVVVAVAGLRSASGIVGPAFLALMIVITIHPLLAWLQRHRVPGWLAVVLFFALAGRKALQVGNGRLRRGRRAENCARIVA